MAAPPKAPHGSSGNRCGHNPRRPRLHPAGGTLREGGYPHILKRAAEKAVEWYKKPYKCSPLLKDGKPMRSERREACQVILETIFSLMDLASLQLGTPTLDNGFVDVDMKQIMERSGLKKRRCERAIAELIRAGFLSTKRRSGQNEQGEYFGLRSIRTVQVALFSWLQLDKRLATERKKASERLAAKALRANKKVSDLFKRVKYGVKRIGRSRLSKTEEERRRRWSLKAAEIMLEHPDIPEMELRRRINTALGEDENFLPA